MLPQRYVLHHKGRAQFKRFCIHIEQNTPEAIVFCGVGYRNRGRKVTKNVPYCRHHLYAHRDEY
jgi:hypothetical protein